MGKSKAPAPPDPVRTAEAEARLNRIDTYRPDGGGQRFGYTNDAGRFVQGVAGKDQQAAVQQVESPTEAFIRNIVEPAARRNATQITRDNFSLPGPARARDTSELGDQIFESAFSRLAPAMAEGDDRIMTNLQSRGLPIGSEAYNEAMNRHQRERDDTLSRLALDADIASRNEQSRVFNLDTQERATALNEMASLLGGAYVPAVAAPSSNVPGINYSGIVNQSYANQVNATNQANAQRGGAFGSLIGLGGAALLACSEERKDVEGHVDPHKALSVLMKLENFVWRYREGMQPDDAIEGARHAGPMAQRLHELTSLGSPDVIAPTDLFAMIIGAIQAIMQGLQTISGEFDKRVSALESLQLQSDGMMC
ncbi:MAG: hypothetical protein AAGE80_05360 [Pseudomonadota bacterium]